MRIIAGSRRGLTLAAVGKGDAAAHLRPTSDRVRESLFNVLGGGKFGDPVIGARVLDLFAGTGALGLEALSRGAEQAFFVENGRKSASILLKNIKICKFEAEATLKHFDATRLGTCPVDPFDLVFLDPPYGKSMGENAIECANQGGWISDDALIVWEESADITVPDGFALLDSRKYGATKMNFLERA